MIYFFKYIKGYYYSFIKGIKNLWFWIPIIWGDRDWDHAYIENILYHKLVNTYNFFISKDSVTNWEVPEQAKSLQALKICIDILDRKRNGFYVSLVKDVFTNDNVKQIYDLEERDQKVFGKLFGKYLSYWWD